MPTSVVNAKRHETYRRVLTKKIKHINALALEADTPIWIPPKGRQFILLSAILRCNVHAGVNSDPADLELEVNDVDVVATVTGPIVSGAVKQLTVIADKPFTAAQPLTLTITDAANGSTKNELELILHAIDLADIYSS